MNNLYFFINEYESQPNKWEINIQSKWISFHFIANDLKFLILLKNFILETKNNPAYRDTENDGFYHVIPEKICNLSPFFDTNVVFQKDGEYDDSYILRIEKESSLKINIDIRGNLLNLLIDELDNAIGDWL